MQFACSENAVVIGISSVLVCNVCMFLLLLFITFVSLFIAFTYVLWTFSV